MREALEEGDQLRRAARAVRRNYRAARRGRSRAEFEAKLGTVFEEADECVDCLEALRDTHIKCDDALITFHFSTFPLSDFHLLTPAPHPPPSGPA